MNNRVLLTSILILWLGWSGVVQGEMNLAHHRMEVGLQPDRHALVASDDIRLPVPRQSLRFALHQDLSVNRIDPASAQLRRLGHQPGLPLWAVVYQIDFPRAVNRFELEYRGRILDRPARQSGEQRLMEESAGIIAPEGVFLAGYSYWYPQLLPVGDRLSFELTVTTPKGWRALTQGVRLEQQDEAVVVSRWQEMLPQEEIYLVAAEFTEYHRMISKVDAGVYLRRPDPALAQRYLDATERYLGMFGALLGDYPYAKFTVVENFWETGYGMPSFTLLGPQVIRFPFVLAGSFPHEILHNWWGNGVYVDYAKGNWTEGLTSYLADHLLQEERGTDAEYRRAALQKYADFVSASRDFPLRRFTSRHSQASEAVGYNKSLMFFHMVRQRLGDERFIAGLHRFYADRRFLSSTYDDLRAAFESESGQDLETEFRQWLDRPGAPMLALGRVASKRVGNGHELSLELKQTQAGEPYRLRVPVAITLAGQQEAQWRVLELNGHQTRQILYFDHEPVRVDVDPQYDVFRRLHPAEIPPALGRSFSEEAVTLVLPAAASPEMQAHWRRFAGSTDYWSRITTVLDGEVKALPKGNVWLLGWENRWLPQLLQNLADQGVAVLDKGVVRLGERDYQADRHSLVLVTAAGDGGTVVWAAAANPQAVAGLLRKLPHYSRYSYLAFEGTAPDNIAKGEWAVAESPLSAHLIATPVARAGLPVRPSLLTVQKH